MMSLPVLEGQVQKRRRNTKACDGCSRRSIRCQPSGRVANVCQHCSDYGEACTYTRVLRKRGGRPKNADSAVSINDGRSTRAASASISLETATSTESAADWKTCIPSQAVVTDLADIFFEVVYPVFPLFHRPSLLRRISRGEHASDRAFCASVMAMCALASARARDGASLASRTEDQLQYPSSESLFDAARKTIPADAPLGLDFHYMRATALLSICCIQYGDTKLMSYYLSLYHTFVSVGSLHDEANWPQQLTEIDLEERRRLYWSIYTLDVFTSVVWSRTVRSREASSNVAYPTRSDDEMSNRSASDAGVQTLSVWIKGWNFVTDLYRVLEHATDDLRRVQSPVHSTPALQALLGNTVLNRKTVLYHITAMYESLPTELKTTQDPTGDSVSDMSSFQAANIAATFQLVRMVYLANERSTIEQKCQVASDVIAGFASVPLAYLRAISVPLLHHLAGIGAILGATFDEGMTESSYQRIRYVLLEMADFLFTLEADLYCSSGTSQKLKAQVCRIDDHMALQRAQVASRTGRGGETLDQAGQHDAGPYVASGSSDPDLSPQYQFPSELFEDWAWAFDVG